MRRSSRRRARATSSIVSSASTTVNAEPGWRATSIRSAVLAAAGARSGPVTAGWPRQIEPAPRLDVIAIDEHPRHPTHRLRLHARRRADAGVRSRSERLGLSRRSTGSSAVGRRPRHGLGPSDRLARPRSRPAADGSGRVALEQRDREEADDQDAQHDARSDLTVHGSGCVGVDLQVRTRCRNRGYRPKGRRLESISDAWQIRGLRGRTVELRDVLTRGDRGGLADLGQKLGSRRLVKA